MMDKTYIRENGILELYVLGALSEAETKDVENALALHDDLQKELSLIEADVEKLAFENAITPSERVKKALFQNISSSNNDVITLNSRPSNRHTLKIVSAIAAACIIGLFYIVTEWNATKNQLKLVEDQNSILNDKFDQLEKDLKETNALYAAINSPDTEKYILKGNALMPEAKLISYVNDEAKSVIINTSYLPELDDEHDYQMWADVKGEMINMGVIDTKKDMLAMTYIDNSESLNITIEPSGGSDHPTVSQLITNIYIK